MTVQSPLVAAHRRVAGCLRSLTVCLALLTPAAAFAPHPGHAGPVFCDWPSRSVRIIVPSAQGSADDIAARAYADGLSRRWMHPVAIDNRPGAAIGSALADGQDDHTLLYGPATLLTVDALLGELPPGDPLRNLLPIAPGAASTIVIAVPDSLPVRSLKDLILHARSKPGDLAWTAGPSLSHLVFATTVKRHRLEMRHAIYRDFAAAEVELAEGQLHVLSLALPAVAAMARHGAAHILAVTSSQREPALPDVPTVAEAGFPEMEIEAISGLFGLRTMPPELRDRIAADMQAVAREPELQTLLAASGQRAVSGTATGFAVAIGRQRIRIQQIMHTVDLKSALK